VTDVAVEQQAGRRGSCLKQARCEAVEAFRRLLQIDANHLEALNVVGFRLPHARERPIGD